MNKEKEKKGSKKGKSKDTFRQELTEKQKKDIKEAFDLFDACLLYTSPSPRDQRGSRMPSSA